MSASAQDAADRDTSAAFRRAVTLTEVQPRGVHGDDAHGDDAHGADVPSADRSFTAVPQYVPWPKAYGGDPVAQAAAAAMATADGGKRLHSLHSTFLRPIDTGRAVRYDVEVVRNGRSYSTRQVRAYQDEKVVFLTTASLQADEDGPEYQASAPAVPEPETLPSSADYLAGRAGAAAEYWSHGRSFDMRHVPGPVYTSVDAGTAAHQAVWVRAFDALGDDPALHQLAVAYVCDYTILESALRALGLHWQSPGLSTASLDHAMWFHRPTRADDWLLYTQEAVSVQTGRGLCTGRFFDRSGRLVASVAQEGLIRMAP